MVVPEVRQVPPDPVQEGQVAEQPHQADHQERGGAAHEPQHGAEPGEQRHPARRLAEADLAPGGRVDGGRARRRHRERIS